MKHACPEFRNLDAPEFAEIKPLDTSDRTA
jgi:hypothetical protein